MHQPHFQCALSQLRWLQDTQLFLDAEMSHVVKQSDNHEHLQVNWDLAFKFQRRLDADTLDLKIPQWAVPDVFATWNAMRICEGKGPINTESIRGVKKTA
ncbi:hypothetical protein PtB15_15B394 [Puccinia triticina]|nr:hypothetical protein PtB15_15B394 [Puccinia triticina]